MIFRTDLLAWMARRGFTQAQAAAALGGVPLRTLQNWCSREAEPHLAGSLRLLMRLLDERNGIGWQDTPSRGAAGTAPSRL